VRTGDWGLGTGDWGLGTGDWGINEGSKLQAQPRRGETSIAIMQTTCNLE